MCMCLVYGLSSFTLASQAFVWIAFKCKNCYKLCTHTRRILQSRALTHESQLSPSRPARRLLRHVPPFAGLLLLPLPSRSRSSAFACSVVIGFVTGFGAPGRIVADS